MSEKWTKGPWFIHPHGPRYTVNQQGTNRHVAMVSCYKSADSDDDENAANAHLIVAAPEMYELITALIEYIDAIPPDAAATLPTMPGVSRDWVEYVCAKARGQL